jgi:hypothetical protein
MPRRTLQKALSLWHILDCPLDGARKSFLINIVHTYLALGKMAAREFRRLMRRKGGSDGHDGTPPMAETSQTGKVIAVSDLGPLISAFQCGRTDLLKRYFSVRYITASELTELDAHGWAGDIRQLIKEGFVVVAGSLTHEEREKAERVAKQIASDPASGDPDWLNHLPEAEALVLMMERGPLMIDLILLDEKAARNVAHDLGVPMTGFPWVAGRAGLDGLVTRDEIRNLLRTCQQQGTYYSDQLIGVVAQAYGR